MAKSKHQAHRKRERMRTQGSEDVRGTDLKPWEVDRELATGARESRRRRCDLDSVGSLADLGTLRAAGQRRPGSSYTDAEARDLGLD